MLEILIVLLIVGVLATLTAPSFTDSIQRNAREGSMRDLMSSIGLARSEAISRASTVAICRSVNQTSCAASTGGDWDAGWIIFTDAGVSGVVNGGDTLLEVRGAGNGQSKLTLKTRANGSFTGDFLQFDTDGFLANSTNGAYFKLCDQANVQLNARAILLGNTGRPALSPVQSDGIYHDLAGANLTCP